MKFSITSTKPDQLKNEVLVYMFSEECVKDYKGKGKTFSLIKDVLDQGDFKGESGQASLVYTHKKIAAKRILLVGLGKREELEVNTIRKAADSIVKRVKHLKLPNLAVVPYHDEKISEKEAIVALVEGITLGHYIWDEWKTDNKKKEVKECVLVTAPHFKDVVKQSQSICENALLVRDLVNQNAEETNAPAFAAVAKKEARKAGLKVTILDEKKIKKLGMGLLLAVNRGSRYPARVVLLEHHGDKRSKETIALVGKGITFDSGGLNLKPSGYMNTMKCDMSGAAAVLGIMKSIGELKIKKNVVGIMVITENSIGPKAYKPGDIFKSYSGKTVEVLNTDAEGRLALADGMAYAIKKFKPSLLIDLATLTGSVVGTFNHYVIGMMGTDDKAADELFKAGQRTHERVWRLPLYKEYKDDMKSDFADLKNISEKRYAGAITAGAFLSNFVGDTPWIHLDIAGPAFLDKPDSYMPKGASGVGVRLLVDYLQNS